MCYRLGFFLCFFALLALPPLAKAEIYERQDDLIGGTQAYRAKAEDSLYRIGRRFDLGIAEMMAANPGVDPWMPDPGQHINLPLGHVLPAAPREGIVINLAELRLYYFIGPDSVYSFPIGIGKEGWQTPTGETKIVRKREDPVWVPPESIRAKNPDLPKSVPAGPDNPLGTHALNLGWASYVIHGTNKPYGIGQRSSHGCIRMYPKDIPVLFDLVSVGTPVTVVDQPYKIGWFKDTLLLEVSPTQQQIDELVRHGSIQSSAPNGNVEGDIAAAAGDEAVLDWPAIRNALRERSGMPVPIGRKTGR